MRCYFVLFVCSLSWLFLLRCQYSASDSFECSAESLIGAVVKTSSGQHFCRAPGNVPLHTPPRPGLCDPTEGERVRMTSTDLVLICPSLATLTGAHHADRKNQGVEPDARTSRVETPRRCCQSAACGPARSVVASPRIRCDLYAVTEPVAVCPPAPRVGRPVVSHPLGGRAHPPAPPLPASVPRAA